MSGQTPCRQLRHHLPEERRKRMERESLIQSGEFEFEWGFYALSVSEAIFRVRTYSRITY